MEDIFDRSLNAMTFTTEYVVGMKLPENLLEKVKADFGVTEKEFQNRLDKFIEIEFISGYDCCCWSEIMYGAKLIVKRCDDEYNTIQSETYSLDDDDELTNKIVQQSLEESFKFMNHLIYDAYVSDLVKDLDSDQVLEFAETETQKAATADCHKL